MTIDKIDTLLVKLITIFDTILLVLLLLFNFLIKLLYNRKKDGKR